MKKMKNNIRAVSIEIETHIIFLLEEKEDKNVF